MTWSTYRVLIGTGSDDGFIGSDGNELFIGGRGDDYMYAGGGDDILLGGSGSDYIDGGAGDDLLVGGSGSDVLIGGSGDDTLMGGSGDDTLKGGEGSDLLIAGGGNDVLIFDATNNQDSWDFYVGGGGNDTLSLQLSLDMFNSTAFQQDYHNFSNYNAYAFQAFNLLTVGIEHLNIASFAVDDHYFENSGGFAAFEDTPFSVSAEHGLLANDFDVEGDSFQVVSYSAASHGSVDINPDGSFTYTPDQDFAFFDSFNYAIEDNFGNRAFATATILVNPVADTPTVSVEDVSGTEGTAIALNIDAALTDISGREQLIIELSGLAEDGFLSAGENQGNGVWLLSMADLEGLTYTSGTAATEAAITANTEIQELNDAKAVLESSQIELAATKTAISEQVAAIVNNQQTLTTLVGTINSTEALQAEVQTELQQYEANLADNQNSSDRLSVEFTDLTDRLTFLEEEATLLESQILTLQGSLNGDGDGDGGDIISIFYGDEIATLDSTVMANEDDAPIINEEIAPVDETLTEDSETYNLDDGLDNGTSGGGLTDTDRFELETQLQDAQNSLDALNTENIQITDQLSILQNQQAEIQNSIAFIETTITNTQQQISDLDGQLSGLNEQISMVEGELNSNQNTLAGLQATEAMLEEQVSANLLAVQVEEVEANAAIDFAIQTELANDLLIDVKVTAIEPAVDLGNGIVTLEDSSSVEQSFGVDLSSDVDLIA